MINNPSAGITAITHFVLKGLAGEYFDYTINRIRLIALYSKFKFHSGHIIILPIMIRFGTHAVQI